MWAAFLGAHLKAVSSLAPGSHMSCSGCHLGDQSFEFGVYRMVLVGEELFLTWQGGGMKQHKPLCALLRAWQAEL